MQTSVKQLQSRRMNQMLLSCDFYETIVRSEDEQRKDSHHRATVDIALQSPLFRGAHFR